MRMPIRMSSKPIGLSISRSRGTRSSALRAALGSRWRFAASYVVVAEHGGAGLATPDDRRLALVDLDVVAWVAGERRDAANRHVGPREGAAAGAEQGARAVHRHDGRELAGRLADGCGAEVELGIVVREVVVLDEVRVAHLAVGDHPLEVVRVVGAGRVVAARGACAAAALDAAGADVGEGARRARGSVRSSMSMRGVLASAADAVAAGAVAAGAVAAVAGARHTFLCAGQAARWHLTLQ